MSMDFSHPSNGQPKTVNDTAHSPSMNAKNPTAAAHLASSAVHVATQSRIQSQIYITRYTVRPKSPNLSHTSSGPL